jgi:hypothetical protein
MGALVNWPFYFSHLRTYGSSLVQNARYRMLLIMSSPTPYELERRHYLPSNSQIICADKYGFNRVHYLEVVESLWLCIILR